MTAHVESIAYTALSGVPWHGMGTPVSDSMTVEEMLVAAKLDWRV